MRESHARCVRLDRSAILANVLDQVVHRQQYIFAEVPVNLHDFASIVA